MSNFYDTEFMRMGNISLAFLHPTYKNSTGHTTFSIASAGGNQQILIGSATFSYIFG